MLPYHSVPRWSALKSTTTALCCLVILVITPLRPSFALSHRPENFKSPDLAVNALIEASRANNVSSLLTILGSDAEPLIHSGDDVEDGTGRQKFVAAYDEFHSLEAKERGQQILMIGANHWPLPIPLQHGRRGWHFDVAKGKTEVLNRRIGRNELRAIASCRAFVEAEREFATDHPLPNHEHSYADRFLSHPDEKDGLYWEVNDGEQPSPLGPLMAAAAKDDYQDPGLLDKLTPFHGYYFRILGGQGAHAPGGALSYYKDHIYKEGFALIAYPARWGDSGIMSFIVNQFGFIYEKNMGSDTESKAAALKLFDPDASWKLVHTKISDSSH